MAGLPVERIQATEMNLAFQTKRIDELESGQDRIIGRFDNLEKRLIIVFSVLLGATLVTSKYGTEIIALFFK